MTHMVNLKRDTGNQRQLEKQNNPSSTHSHDPLVYFILLL